jgi:hypothetical protein
VSIEKHRGKWSAGNALCSIALIAKACGGLRRQPAQMLKRAACPSAVSARWVAAQARGWRKLARGIGFGKLQRRGVWGLAAVSVNAGRPWLFCCAMCGKVRAGKVGVCMGAACLSSGPTTRSSGRPYGGFCFLLIQHGQRHRVAA